MSNILVYTLKLNDLMSSTLNSIGAKSDAVSGKLSALEKKTAAAGKGMSSGVSNLPGVINNIGANSDAVSGKLSALEQKAASAGKGLFSGMSNILGAMGITAGIYQIGTLFTEGIEKAHQLHQAEAQLANTMQNMGTYSQEAYEKAVAGSANLAANIKFSKGEIIGLQSQLRLVGNIGSDEMDRLVGASADMATKFGMGLDEAGNAIAKAVNNPEMMRRLAMQLKIDPATVEHIQNLAKHGKDAKARLELIDVVEKKIGGSAKAAFNADPSARFEKAMGKIKLLLGEIGIWLQVKIMPAVEWMATNFTAAFNYIRPGLEIISTLFGKLFDIIGSFSIVQKIVNIFRSWWEMFNQGNPIIIVITAILGAFLAITIAHSIWMGIAAAATWLWNTAATVLNGTLLANPVGLIIAAIVALIAVIAYVIYKTDGWGILWNGLITFFKNSWEAFKEYFIILWLEVQDKFMTGVELIERGWYKVKSLWDKEGADAGLAKLNDESAKRAEAIAKAKGKYQEYTLTAAQGLVDGFGGLKWNSDRSLGDVVTGLKDKLGIGDSKISPSGLPGGDGKGMAGSTGGSGDPGKITESIATGGTKNTTITLTLRNLIENFTVQGGNLKETAENIRDVVVDELTRALSMAQGNVQ
jgi:hypothetical protein